MYDQEKDLNTVVFENSDGTKTLYYYAELGKYIDEDGKVQDKSSALTAVAGNARSKKYEYVNEDNDVRTYFPNSITEGIGVLLENKDISIELTPVGTSKTRNTDVAKKIQIEDDLCSAEEAVAYDNVFGNNTEIRYTPLFNGFKEEIILDSYSGTNKFAFILKTNGLKMVESDGRWYLADPDTKEYVVSVGELIVCDSSEETKEDVLENLVNYDHYYMVETLTANSEYKITAVVDEKYLLSSDTEYPVIVDPSFEIISSNNGIMDIFVDQSGTIYKEQKLLAGELAEEQMVYRTFIKFPGLLSSWQWAALAPGGYGSADFPEITKLTLSLYNMRNGFADTPVKVYQYSGNDAVDWSYNDTDVLPTSFTSANFHAKGIFASSTIIGVMEGWNEIDLTDISAFDLSKGIVIQNQYESLYDEAVLKLLHSTRNTTSRKYR